MASGAGLAHVVASAHSVEHRNPDLSQVQELIGQDLSWQYARVLLEEKSPAGFPERGDCTGAA